MSTFAITHASRFIDGVNYQHHYGFDFGEHPVIRDLGLHLEHRMEQVRHDFALLASCGIHSIRMNVFTDGRTGITYDPSGSPRGAQESVSEGLLNVLRIAEESAIAVSLVMFDHKFAERAEWVDQGKPELGTKQGHGKLLVTEAGRSVLLENVLKPLLLRIGDAHPQNLLSFELVNEPESIVEGLSTDPFIDTLVPSAGLGELKSFMRLFRDIARDATGAQFTVGSLALKHADSWIDVLDPNRDYLSIHYYGANNDPPYPRLYRSGRRWKLGGMVEKLQRRIPVVWGEYAANGALDFRSREYPQGFSNAAQFLRDALEHGMKGAYAWACRSGLGEWGDLFGPVPLEQHRRFAAANARRIEFLGAPPPSQPAGIQA